MQRSLLLLLAFIAFGCTSPPPTREPSAPAHGGSEPKRIDVSPGVVLVRACTPTGPELCFNARDDNCNGVIDEGCGVSTGLVQFVIAWDEPSADVDLQVTDPNGELVEASRVAESGLVKEQDCPGPNNECHGQNLENVYLDGDAELLRGTYRVVIRLESLGDAEPPVTVTLGVRLGPKSYAAEVTLSAPRQEREAVFQL